MPNLQEKKEDYILSLDKSGKLTKMDIIEQNLNAIDFGYDICKKEYEEKLRFIPVQEKTPEKDEKRIESNFSKFVLVKDLYNVPFVAFYNFSTKDFYLNALKDCPLIGITHWRYIF